MKKYLLIISYSILALTACTPYVAPIEQGNILKADMIEQLELGMSKSQTEYILGSSIIKDSFNPDRWDYIYTLKQNHRPLEYNQLTLVFKNDHLVSFTGTAIEKAKQERLKAAEAKQKIAHDKEMENEIKNSDD